MTTIPCPCCGTPVRRLPVDQLPKVLTPIAAEVVELLARRPEDWVLMDRIIEHVWRRNPEGEPSSAQICISSALARNKPRLQALGWDIESRRYQPGGYRLVWKGEKL